MNLKNNLKYISILFIIFILVFIVVDYLLTLKIDSLKHDKLITVSQNLKNLTKQLIDDKSYATLNIAIALSENQSYKKFLLGDETQTLNLKDISLKTRKHSNFKNIWIHLVDANGTSRYRSWTTKKGDSLLKVRKEMIHLLKNPKVTSVISVGIFDITFKSIVPIYDNNKFLGHIEVITKFNSIAKKLEKEGIDLVILVDKKYKKQIKKPFTKMFIDNYYVANINAKKQLRDIIQKDIDKFILMKEYEVLNNKFFVTTLPINDFADTPMSYITIFTDYKSIYLEEIKNFEQFIKIIGILISISIVGVFFTYYFYARSKYTKKLEEEVKQRTRELKISTMKYLQLFENSQAMKLIVDPKTKKILDANNAALRFYGYTKEQIKTLNSADINIDTNNNLEKVFSQILNKEKNFFIFKHKLASGEIRDVEVYSSLIEIEDESLIYSIIRDITDDLKLKKEFEEKQKLFYQQAKLASMGEMLENIAHQWRQPLSTITTAASGIKLKKEFESLDDNYLDDSVDIIVRSANFLSQTIEDFRNFFKHSNSIEKFKISSILKDSFSILKLKLDSNNIQTHIEDKDNIELKNYKNEFIQVLLNILNNSVDAFKSNDINDDKVILINISKDKNNIILTIQDSAKGIDKKIIDKVFEPYFTTKHKSQGTGIGLYMSEQIVVKHLDGEITVQNKYFEYNSKKLYGARFKITIPLL